MPQIIALSCPVCAAPLNPDDEKCTFCGSYIVIKTDLPKLNRLTLNQSVIQEHITDFRRRVRSNSYDEEAHYGLGLAYFNLGLVDAAVDELRQAAKLMPENPHIQAQLAVALRDSFKAGNQSAEQEMQTRIHNALLLDPTHVEAILLKAETLFGNGQYEEVLTILEPIMASDSKRAEPWIVAATQELFSQRMANRDWQGVQQSWRKLEPIDPNAAKSLALRFLDTTRDYVPKRFNISKSLGEQSQVIEHTKPKRALFALLAAIGGLVVGFIQLAVIVTNIPRDDATGANSGWGLFAFLLSFLLFLALPIIGAVVGYRRSGKPKLRTRPQFQVTNFKREEVLSGAAELSVISTIADEVIVKLIKEEESNRSRRR